MELNNKILIGGAIGLFLLGGVIDHFITPTKVKTVVETKTEVKTVKENVYVDRIITKVVKPDGTITEKIIEKDRSKIDTREKIDEKVVTKEITNPKQFGVALAWKSDILNIELPAEKDLGVQVYADTGILNTYTTGSVFIDGTVVLTLGVKF